MSQLSRLWVQLGGGTARTSLSHLRDFNIDHSGATYDNTSSNRLNITAAVLSLRPISSQLVSILRHVGGKNIHVCDKKGYTFVLFLFFFLNLGGSPWPVFDWPYLSSPLLHLSSPLTLSLYRIKHRLDNTSFPAAIFCLFFISSSTVILYWLMLAESHCVQTAPEGIL